jgi:hypothetical protein
VRVGSRVERSGRSQVHDGERGRRGIRDGEVTERMHGSACGSMTCIMKLMLNYKTKVENK